MDEKKYELPWEAQTLQSSTNVSDYSEYEEEEEESCPAGTICSNCGSEIKEMYDDHLCLGHYCDCN